MPDRRPPLNHKLRCFAALFLLALPLAACGKLPNQVDPPAGVSEKAFPKTYPDPATDPKP